MKRLLCIMLMFSIGAFCVGCGNSSSKDDSKDNKQTEESSDKSSSSSSNKEERSIITLKEENSTLTYEDFKNIKLGISYEECKAGIGEANMLVQESDKKTYTWKMGNNKTISVVVQDNIIKSKAQGLLNDNKIPITRAQYDSLNNGMTLDEVKAIVGNEGVFTNAELQSDGKTKTLYSYHNGDASSAILTFVDNALYSKSNNNLE